jgi:hypothetical protein
MCLRTWHLHTCGHATSSESPCAEKWKDNLNNCPKYRNEEDTGDGECARCVEEKKAAERREEEKKAA